jgi:hypothetical protein
MNGTRRMAGLAMCAALSLILGCVLNGFAQTPAGGQEPGGGKQPYTMAEYNCYTAAQAEKNPAQQIKLLDDCVAKYSNSALLIYEYPLYYQAYSQLKNYAKVIEYADKLVALGEKADSGARYQALYARAYAYNAMNSNDPAQGKAAEAAAVAGLKALDELKKPENITEDAFKAEKAKIQIYFNGTAAQAALVQKDYASAVNFYKAVLAQAPDDAITSYRLGLAYMGLNPPQQMDAFWSIARAVTSKNATEQQSKQVKGYLRKLMVNYQQASCDNLIDAELNELLQLASSSLERPASYKIPSAADLEAARTGPPGMTIASVVTDLKAGGDKAKVTWLAACGLEFPDIPGRLLEVVPGTDAVILKTAFVTSQAEFDLAKTPNMEFKVAGQPGAEKLEKDSAPRITGTLASYDPDPAFMLHWDKAKVNEEDLPKEKAAPKKPVAKRPAAKKPGN